MTNKAILKGTYCILIHLKSNQAISIGKLGEIKFQKGYYAYVGSALNSLMPRIKRHLSPDKKLHWHIDYFLGHRDVEVVDVLYIVDDNKWECELACNIADSARIIENFGCSDCKCFSHLFYFKELDDLKENCINSFEVKTLSPTSYFENERKN